MECEEFILPDWSPPDDPARPCRPKAGHGLVMMMMMMIYDDIYLCYHENAQNRIPAITMAGQKILTQARTARNEKR